MNRSSALAAAAVLAVFALLPLALARPLAAQPAGDAPQQNRSAPRSACAVQSITTTLRPAAPRLCDSPEVSVTLGITCPPVLPVHLVIAIDRSKSIADPAVSQIIKDIQRSAREVIDALDFEAHPENKIGVLSHGFRVTVETELTHQKSRAIGAINGVKYQANDLGEDPAKAVDEARKMLEDDRGTGSPLEIILLYGDGCDASVAGCAAASKRAAAQADSRGMAVMLMCYKDSTRETCATSYRQMASQNNYYFENESQIPNRVTDLTDQGKQLKVDALAFLEKLAPGFSFVAGSGVPAPQVSGQDLTFNFKDLLPGQVISAKYRVQPKAEGKQPLRGASTVNLTDSLNRAGDPLTVPSHEVSVGPCVVETPTPTTTPTTPATATRTPSATPRASDTPAATRTPADTPVPTQTRTPTRAPSATATATPAVVAVYLPITMRQVCKPGEVHTDVILIIDASSSMREPSGTTTKIDAARKAALDFVDNLKLGKDQAAVLSFNAQARLDLPLSRDRAALERAINGISTAAGTRIDLALERAGQELASGRPIAGNNRAVILLTDGRTDAGTADRALAAAAALKNGKAAIYTIGLGADVDAAFLRQVATSPSMYLEAPTADQLAGIYDAIAGTLPCPGGVFWGG